MENSSVLPRDWLDEFPPDQDTFWKRFPTRREAEDTAALAFSRLPADRRAELLATGVPA